MPTADRSFAPTVKKLSELSTVIANALFGDSKFTEDALALAITATKERIADNVALIEEKKKQLDNNEADMLKLDYYYEQFVSRADGYDNASPERMIVNHDVTDSSPVGGVANPLQLNWC